MMIEFNSLKGSSARISSALFNQPAECSHVMPSYHPVAISESHAGDLHGHQREERAQEHFP